MLNAEQQQKFQALREQLRRRLLDSMAAEAYQETEGGLK